MEALYKLLDPLNTLSTSRTCSLLLVIKDILISLTLAATSSSRPQLMFPKRVPPVIDALSM